MARILLIDDDPLLRATLGIALKRAGHDIHCAADGEEGLEFLASHNADIVVTDIVMPRKEGIETIIALRKQRPDIRIIAISGGGKTAEFTYLQMALKLGASRTLAKPFTMKAMIDCVDDLERDATPAPP